MRRFSTPLASTGIKETPYFRTLIKGAIREGTPAARGVAEDCLRKRDLRRDSLRTQSREFIWLVAVTANV